MSDRQSTGDIAAAAASLAPSGRLRAAINLGNPVLAQRDARSGRLTGASVAIAEALAERLHLPLELEAYPAAAAVFAAQGKDRWDLAFMAAEPERADGIEFSPPYVFIDGTYLVPRDAPYGATGDLDRPGVRIAVGRGAAYDLYLSRTLRQAELIRAETSIGAIELFLAGRVDAAAGIRQALVDTARSRPDLRVLEDRFTRIEQAVAIPKGRPAAAAFIRTLLEELKASGRIRAALDATGQDGAIVA